MINTGIINNDFLYNSLPPGLDEQPLSWDRFPELKEYIGNNECKDNTFLSELQNKIDLKIHELIKLARFDDLHALVCLSCDYISFDNHSMKNMHTEVERKLKLQRNKNFGAHFHGFGGTVVKGGNIRVDRLEKGYVFQLKLLPFVREEIEKNIQFLFQKNPILAIKDEIIKLADIPYTYCEIQGDFGRAHQLCFKNSEEIIIGKSIQEDSIHDCLYNTVRVMLPYEDDSVVLKKLYYCLSFVGLGSVVIPQTEEQDVNMKILRLFQQFSPYYSSWIRNNKEFHTKSITDIKDTCIKLDEKMKEVFDKYLIQSPHLIEKVESYPERFHWSVKDITASMKMEGGCGLYSYITSDKTVDVVSSILTLGALSTEDRYQAKIPVHGINPYDHMAGSAGHIFTRLFAVGMSLPLKNLATYILYDLDVTSQGGVYAYLKDTCGSKNDSIYRTRPTLPIFARVIFARVMNESRCGDEVMIPHYIHPKHLRRVVCTSTETRDELINALKKNDAIQDKTINGLSIDEFVIMEDSKNGFTEEMWKKQAVQK